MGNDDEDHEHSINDDLRMCVLHGDDESDIKVYSNPPNVSDGVCEDGAGGDFATVSSGKRP
jgi:hypothetical protein